MTVPVIEAFTTATAANASSVAPAKPSGVAVGETLVLIAMADDDTGSATFAAKTGWTKSFEIGDGTTDVCAAVYWRIADGTEGATETISSDTGSEDLISWYLRISGAHASAPFDGAGAASEANTVSAITADSFTTGAADCLAFALVGFDGSDTVLTPDGTNSWPAAFPANQELAVSDGGAPYVEGGWVTKSVASAGASGDCDFSSTVTDGMVAIQFAIAPSAGDPAPGWLTTPYISLQDEDSYNITLEVDYDATVYAVAVKAGETAPTIAQVKAGNGTGDVAAIAAANDTFDGDTEPSDLVLGGSLTRPVHDIYVVANNAAGDSSLVTLAQELLDAPAGYQYVSIAIKEISAITKADPARTTVDGHGWLTGQQTRAWGVTGMTEINGSEDKPASPDDGLLYFEVTKVDADDLDLDDIDSSAFGTYTGPSGYMTPGFSFLEDSSPAAIDNDILKVEDDTQQGGYTISANPDGTFSYAAGGDDTRQDIAVNHFDVSADAWVGEVTFTINNSAPSLIGAAIPEQTWPQFIAIAEIDVVDWIQDVDGDAMTHALIDEPAGISIAAGIISGTPTTAATGEMYVRSTDTLGDYTDFLISYDIESASEPDPTAIDWPKFLTVSDAVENI